MSQGFHFQLVQEQQSLCNQIPSLKSGVWGTTPGETSNLHLVTWQANLLIVLPYFPIQPQFSLASSHQQQQSTKAFAARTLRAGSWTSRQTSHISFSQQNSTNARVLRKTPELLSAHKLICRVGGALLDNGFATLRPFGPPLSQVPWAR